MAPFPYPYTHLPSLTRHLPPTPSHPSGRSRPSRSCPSARATARATAAAAASALAQQPGAVGWNGSSDLLEFAVKEDKPFKGFTLEAQNEARGRYHKSLWPPIPASSLDPTVPSPATVQASAEALVPAEAAETMVPAEVLAMPHLQVTASGLLTPPASLTSGFPALQPTGCPMFEAWSFDPYPTPESMLSVGDSFASNSPVRQQYSAPGVIPPQSAAYGQWQPLEYGNGLAAAGYSNPPPLRVEPQQPGVQLPSPAWSQQYVYPAADTEALIYAESLPYVEAAPYTTPSQYTAPVPYTEPFQYTDYFPFT